MTAADARRARVLHVLEATEGGTRRHVTDLLLGADRARFDVEYAYATRRADGALAGDLARLREAGVVLHTVDMGRAIHPLRDARALASLVALFRRRRPDLVHLHAAKAGLLGRVAARLLGPRPRVVYSPHGGSFHAVYGSVGNRVFTAIERAAAPLADAVVNVSAHSTRVYAEVVGGPPSRLVTILNGIAPLAPLPAGEAAARRASLGIPADAMVLAHVAQLNGNKGHATLLEALALVGGRPGLPPVHAILAGEGQLRASLEARASAGDLAGRVHFLGYRTDAGAWMDAADVVVLPSMAEAFGLVLVEGMSLGKPAIATRVGGIPEIVAHGETGLLVPPGDAAALAEAIAALAADAGRRARMGEAGRQRAAAFGPERMVRETEALYARLLAAR